MKTTRNLDRPKQVDPRLVVNVVAGHAIDRQSYLILKRCSSIGPECLRQPSGSHCAFRPGTEDSDPNQAGGLVRFHPRLNVRALGAMGAENFSVTVVAAVV